LVAAKACLTGRPTGRAGDGSFLGNLPIVLSSSRERSGSIRRNYIHIGYIYGTMPPTTAPESLIPLPPAVFHILLSLADEDRHGYAIIQDVTARTGGDVRLGAGTLYRSIQRMLEQDLIVETGSRPEPEADDERRRYYRITAFGRKVAGAEAERLAGLVQLARASGVIPRKA